MGGLAELWDVWGAEFLLLSSLLLQVFLLIFTELRRCVSGALLSAALNGILWLLYLLADSVAIYILGHMSLSSKPHEQQQIMAFWASLLMVHLGGQDTITAYAMEDNNLWLRHLFILLVQAAGAAYVLRKYGSGVLLAAAILMFLVGVAKYCERIYALKFAGLDTIGKFLNGFEVMSRDISYPVPASLDAEEVLQGAHDLLPLSMSQFLHFQINLSDFQITAIFAYHDRTNPDGSIGRSMLLQLLGMQLSLVRDILYTKTVVIHTRYGCVSRFVSVVSTIVAFYLFQLSIMTAGRYSRRDTVVTYILLAGAFFLEAASLLRVAMSTWTCAWLRAAGWNCLHAAVVYLRRCVMVAHNCRRWSGSIGQQDLLPFKRDGKTGVCYAIASCFGLEKRWNRLRFTDYVVISHVMEDLLLQEVQRMVEACGENVHTLWGYRGQLARGTWGAEVYDLLGVDEIGFDGSILAWHYATDAFLHFFDLCMLERDCIQSESEDLARVPHMKSSVLGMLPEERELQKPVAELIRTLSRYMVFLLAERPHLLPSPVRRGHYDFFIAQFKEFPDIEPGDSVPYDIRPEVELAKKLLARCEEKKEPVAKVLGVISGVWVEMLCYAAGHCSNDSHGRQLSSGTEFITVVWFLTTALYKRFHYNDRQDSRRVQRRNWLRYPVKY
ncbi:uncharacterized protein LOC104585251 [Brachypodium distachyon]|uniref:DUF4220 domain-containing protein n=1 Tax=Brachypodium distachyon TaxID=15368 RepID=A0A2K2CEQ8_BRADI|nr:uncharacterized protein LOC104585251 [Brachypodium distachyon]XP_010239612.1 uncharacterized protein LOC104585251 [Brachypodium distachyon]XP_014750897.1 uncharacterized protein LOC104585251 [Brachypodium distachyon]XP_024311325.1 uncharacterized protein LOC104585251 [Brachypodium distachyon]PNT60510.1 hypothetical protein BRADI_5g01030v3 [Brachypodium distachyon]PNT60512.1 hypothetical protein BRADI_5g01030v3 [Brachypodium distachyon]PNT60513.1 hypothetical protein BRADI_5g01030v3 [Brachy|eukprot:XP_010239611.1 uncharacterized protein LOC104585251 [Brachypodium distachyon]